MLRTLFRVILIKITLWHTLIRFNCLEILITRRTRCPHFSARLMILIRLWSLCPMFQMLLTSSISKMDDRYVVLLEKVIAENIRSRKGIKTRDSEQRNMIQELASKMASSSNSVPKIASRKKTRKILIQQQCRVSVFKMFSMASWQHTKEQCMQVTSFLSFWNKRYLYLNQDNIYFAPQIMFVYYIVFPQLVVLRFWGVGKLPESFNHRWNWNIVRSCEHCKQGKTAELCS